VFPENFGEHMAIDETGLINGELYTILLNKKAKGKKGAIAAFIKGTKSKNIVDAIYKKTKMDDLLKIKEITLDLANNMEWIAMQIAPQATYTYDRFHVQQLVSDAVQTIRIKHRWIAQEEENNNKIADKKNHIPFNRHEFSNGDTQKQLLARSRHLLYKPISKWTDSQKARAKILFTEFPDIKYAYNLSMYFRNCYENPSLHSFREWIGKVISSDLKELKAVAYSIDTHLPGIMAYFINKSTNANIESFNAKLKLFRQNTRGIKEKNFFIFRILNYFV